MPCVSEWPWEADARRSSELKAMKNELDSITRLLCGLCRYIEDHNATVEFKHEIVEFDSELSAWWEKHKEADKKRKKRELEEARARKQEEDRVRKEQKKLDDQELALYNKLRAKYEGVAKSKT